MLNVLISVLAMVLAIGSAAYSFGLRRKLQSLSAKASASDTSNSNLAAELEAQALLARQMSVDLEELRKHLLGGPEASRPVASSWDSVHMPLNLNRRGQILRLSRKGKTIAEIANDLSVAQGEVELLLKVQDLTQKDLTQEDLKQEI